MGTIIEPPKPEPPTPDPRLIIVYFRDMLPGRFYYLVDPWPGDLDVLCSLVYEKGYTGYFYAHGYLNHVDVYYLNGLPYIVTMWLQGSPTFDCYIQGGYGVWTDNRIPSSEGTPMCRGRCMVERVR